MRAKVEKKMAQREKEKREESLRQLAQKAREERAGIRRAEGMTSSQLLCLFLLIPSINLSFYGLP